MVKPDRRFATASIATAAALLAIGLYTWRGLVAGRSPDVIVEPSILPPIERVLSGRREPDEAADNALRIYGVHINRTPKQTTWTGLGVYLGNGLVITAAHVAGFTLWTRPRVEMGGHELPTTVLKDGYLHFHSPDLTLLSVDEAPLSVSRRLHRMTLCQGPPWVGEEVIVAIPEGVARSYVMSPSLLPPGVDPQYHTVISYTAGSGESGSGVFDAYKKCLVGIITRRIWRTETKEEEGHEITEQHNVAKYFIPASTIAAFIPPEVRCTRLSQYQPCPKQPR